MELETILALAELGGTIVTVGLFLYYIIKKDKATAEKDKQFMTIVSNHINHHTEALTRLLAFLKNGNNK